MALRDPEILDAMSALLVIVDRQGRVVRFNRAFERLTGYSTTEIEGTFVWERLVLPEDREAVKKNLELVFKLDPAQLPFTAENWLVLKDGRRQLISWSLTTLKESDTGTAQYLIGTATEITTQREIEKKLYLTNKRFHTLFEQSPLAFQIYAPDGRLLFANQASLELFQVSYQEALHYNLLQDQQLVEAGVIEQIQRAFAGEIVNLPTLTYNSKLNPKVQKGTKSVVRTFLFPIKDKQEKIVEIVVMQEDVTEQREMEAQLEEREEQYRQIFESTSDALMITDLETALVVEANLACCTMHGYSYEEFIGLHPSTFIHPDSIPLFGEFLETLRTGKNYRCQAKDLRKDGSSFHVEVFGTILSYKGKPHVLAILRDITERVESYQLLEQRVNERTRELASLLEISRNLTSTLQLAPLLELVLNQLKLVVDYTGASIAVFEGDEIVFLATRRPDVGTASEAPVGRFAKEQASMLLSKLDKGAPVVIGDVRDNSEEALAYQQFAGNQLGNTFKYVTSWLGVPLVQRGQMIGVITVSHTAPHYYTSRHATLLLAIANQAAIAIENAHLYEEAQKAAALEERQRLARELHDSVSQALFGISLGTNSARLLMERDPSRVIQSLDYIYSLAQTGMAEMRALLFELRPESLESEGLVVALTKQSAAVQARYEIEVDSKLGPEPEIPLWVKEGLYRIAQEAMHNTIKHAKASRIELKLGIDQAYLKMEVKDNGAGFDPNGSFPGHLGLQSMRERTQKLGGIFEIKSTKGSGTRIAVAVPLK